MLPNTESIAGSLVVDKIQIHIQSCLLILPGHYHNVHYNKNQVSYNYINNFFAYGTDFSFKVYISTMHAKASMITTLLQAVS